MNSAATLESPRLSTRLKRLGAECQAGELTLGALLERLGLGSHPFLILMLSLPFLLPIPLPGLSFVFGLVIAGTGLGLAFGRPIWVPSSLASRVLSGAVMGRAFALSGSLLFRVEGWVKPRLVGWIDRTPTRVVFGLIITISGILLALPLPPGTNFPPAFVCALLSLSILERDGVLGLVGVGAFLTKIALIVSAYQVILSWIRT